MNKRWVIPTHITRLNIFGGGKPSALHIFVLRHKKSIVPIVFLLLLTLLFFWKLAFTNLILARGDTYVYFYPYWDIRNEAFRMGALPLWSPYIFMGVPLLANPQIGTFYPLNWLTTPFSAPDAIRYSILLHVLWGGIGAFVLAKRSLSLDIMPSLVSAILFAFGGYIGAHVEQINQLQGLAWIPWLFVLFHQILLNKRIIFHGILLAMAIALQIFTGHTQTVFISGVGLGIYGVVYSWMEYKNIGHVLKAIVILALVAILAVLLAIPQILPTLELTGLSNRQGGFTVQQATAFSLPIQYIGHSFLPLYEGQLFGEYIVTIGVIGLGLAGIGIFQPIANRKGLVWVVLVAIGLLFAFGRFNPIYLLLAELPGFNLFRVPARWLTFVALGLAMLAGVGLQRIQQIENISHKSIFAVAGSLVSLAILTRFILQVDAEDIVGSAHPSNQTMLFWVIAVGVFVGIIELSRLIKRPQIIGDIACFVIVLELFLASRISPYNDLTTPDVYEGQRLTISQMLAYQDETNPLGRFLSISGLFFDPGDKTTLETYYEREGLGERAIRHALVATKRQELLFPNLSQKWGVSSIDGFGGGLLPTTHYTQFTSLLLPPDTLRTIDGRLGEMFALPECRGACIPPIWIQDMMDMQYLITDKVYDIWHDDVAYDTTLPVTGSEMRFDASPYLSRFDANIVSILYVGDATPIVELEGEILERNISQEFPVFDNLQMAQFQADFIAQTPQVSITSDETITVYAVTLIDNRTGIFLQLTPEAYMRVLSSDVKIYQRTEPLQRVYVVPNATIFPDTWQGSEDALEYMQSEEFIPNQSVVIHTDSGLALSATGQLNATASIVKYNTNEIVVEVEASDNAYLVLSDAMYPGWQATINNQATEIYRANVMFRAVQVPVGKSTVIFSFEPRLWYQAMMGGAVVWLILVGGLFAFKRR